MPIRIGEGFMRLEIDGRVVATATERADGLWEVTYWPRFFDHNRAITALMVTELLESGRGSNDPVVAAFCEELRWPTADRPGEYHQGMTFSRITTDPDVMGGQPTIRGLRMPVATVVAMVANGMAVGEIIAEHPDLTPEDVREALLYAAEAVRERELPLRHSA
jgi:uncharacterized protein (DUF433 family)